MEKQSAIQSIENFKTDIFDNTRTDISTSEFYLNSNLNLLLDSLNKDLADIELKLIEYKTLSAVNNEQKELG
jgi:hypothetical protein